MKIPTLLGLALLITSLSFGMLIYYYQQKTQAQTVSYSEPQNIRVVNIEDNSVTIVWQSAEPNLGEIAYSENNKLDLIKGDNRDHGLAKEHTVHFITLDKLKPDTKYFYKIKIGNAFYPDAAKDFKTAKSLSTDPPVDINKPIRGTVLNTNLNPIDEALIFLNIKDAQDIATFTSTAGNFIIPLSTLRNSDLSDYYRISDKVDATLLIKRNDIESIVTLSLPVDKGPLPPLTIGQNINLQELNTASNSAVPILTELPVNKDNKKFDLNNDGIINSLDLATVVDLYNRGKNDKKADFNTDGIIDQSDIDLLTQSLQH